MFPSAAQFAFPSPRRILTRVPTRSNDRSALDKDKKKITLLSPLPGRLPRRTLIVGSVDWVDA